MKRAQYEAKWHTFVTVKKDDPILYSDVPWLAVEQPRENVKGIILYGTDGEQLPLQQALVGIG